MHPPDGTIQVSGSNEASRLLAEFALLSAEDKRRVIARLNDLDPDKVIIVKAPDGTLSAREVSYETRARLLGMGAAGFETVTGTNRRQRRARAAIARHTSPKKRK